MAHKKTKKAVQKKVAKQKKVTPSMRCPTNPKVDPKGATGVCYTVERVQRNGHKGYITAFTSRATGKSAGFSSAPGACRKTMDPFQASIRKSKADAEKVGQQCSNPFVIKIPIHSRGTLVKNK
jgi:hypothetical protein